MDAATENSLVTLVHQGVVAIDGWTGFIEALRGALGALHANLTFRRTDAPMSDSTSYASGGPIEHMSRLYLDSFHRDDPLPYYQLAPGRVYTLSDIFGPDDQAVRGRFSELLGFSGNPQLLIVRITEPGGANAWLTVIRNDVPFGEEERAVLTHLGQHLAIALSVYVRLADTEARLASYTSAMDRLSVGIMTLAKDGRIIDCDAIVSGLIANGDIMARDPHGRLVLSDKAAARALTTALRDFAQEPAGRPRAVRLSEQQRADMLLLPVADRPATGRFTPVLRAYVHTDVKPMHDTIETLVEMFRLTRSEAKLALALAEGYSLAEAAGVLGFTPETTRTYCKRIFQKTGTRRQAELVRALLTSTLRLA